MFATSESFSPHYTFALLLFVNKIWFWASFGLIKQFRMLPRSVFEMRIMLKADKINTKNLLDYQFYQIRMPQSGKNSGQSRRIRHVQMDFGQQELQAQNFQKTDQSSMNIKFFLRISSYLQLSAHFRRGRKKSKQPKNDQKHYNQYVLHSLQHQKICTGLLVHSITGTDRFLDGGHLTTTWNKYLPILTTYPLQWNCGYFIQ